MAAAKALLAEGRAPETEIAMKHEGSTIVVMQGKIGTLAALPRTMPRRRKALRRPKRARGTAVSPPWLKLTKAVPKPPRSPFPGILFYGHDACHTRHIRQFIR